MPNEIEKNPATHETFAPLAVFEANVRLQNIRKEAQLKREKAKSYTGKFPENENERMDALLKLRGEMKRFGTIGMNEENMAVETINQFIKTLESHVKSAKMKTIIDGIRDAFELETQNLTEGRLTLAEYVEKCEQILLDNAENLKKPQTIIERVQHFLINSLRAVLNLFDRFLTWAKGNESTKANDPEYKAYVQAPKTELAQELETILEKSIPALHRELEEKRAAQEKADARAQRVNEAAKNPREQVKKRMANVMAELTSRSMFAQNNTVATEDSHDEEAAPTASSVTPS